MKKIISLGTVVVLLVAVVTFTAPTMVESATAETGSYMLKFYDGHMHTIFSDGNGTVADIVATAISRGLDAVIITDHSENLTVDEWNWLVGNCSLYQNETFLALPGFEMTGSESVLNRDHFNVYNVSSPFVTDDLVASEVWTSPPNPNGTGPVSLENLTNWVNWAHSQGGVVVHNHPSGTTKAVYGADVIEIYNQGHIDEINAIGAMLPPELGGPYYNAGYIINNLAIYGEKYLTEDLKNAIYTATSYMYGVGIWLGAPENPLNSWDDFLLNYTTEATDYVPFAVGNTDTHNTGSPNSTVGVAKTGVYVQNFTANDLYEAIKKGRSFVTSGPIISFNISGTMMGETLFLADTDPRTMYVKIESSGPSANITYVDIIKNGVSWQTFNPNDTSFEAQITLDASIISKNSSYRIEVVEYDPVLNETHYAYSNPIFVKLPPQPGDVNRDGTVNIVDIVAVAIAFDTKPGDPKWDERSDVNYDKQVNIIDIVSVAIYFDQTYP